MQKFKTLATSRLAVFIGGVMLALLVAWPLVGAAQDKADKAKDPDPHAQHKDKQPSGDKELASQIAELRAKVAKLEAALEKTQSGMSGMGDKKKGMGGMSGMGMMDMDPKKGMGAMGGDKAGMMDEQMMQMMQMMQQMMQMKMMDMMGKGMGSGMPDMKGMQTPGMKGMKMGTKGMEMGRKGMEMGMKGMEMPGMKGMEMMGGKGMAGMQTPSALPGFPGASHIYHIGSTGFFLDHSAHIKLTTEQQTALNQAKEKGLLEQSSFKRKIDDAEQDLWTLTSSDKPDATKIDAKVREIEKLRGDQRLVFIRAVGEAAKVLTDDQRKTLLGTGASKADPHAGH